MPVIWEEDSALAMWRRRGAVAASGLVYEDFMD
jgi:hypothetical protein